MFCEKCNESFYPQALSQGNCVKCGKPTPTPHIPSYKVCKECSEEHKVCQQCGKEMK